MKTHVLLLALLGLVLAVNGSILKEKLRREANKQEHLRKIAAHNAGDSTFTMGLSKVTAWGERSWEEFKEMYLMKTDMSNARNLELPAESEFFAGELPAHFDWRDHGAVTPVGDQEPCGCCYAFSTTGNVESVWKVKKGVLRPLSKQQIVDCCKVPCSATPTAAAPECCDGCNEGYTGTVLRYIHMKGGLEPEADYKFMAKKENQCHFNRSEIAATINGQVMMPQLDEDKMARYLYTHGAISISINANDKFTNYQSGIFDDTPQGCPNAITDLNHAILLVGFGEESGIPYWIVKNSWSDTWGEKGYVRMARGKNLCGLALYSTSAVVN